MTEVPSETVPASGSTSPRAVAEHLADLPFIKHFGAAGDGRTNDSAAFNAAQAAGPVLLGPGSYYFDGSVVPTAQPVMSLGRVSLSHHGLPGNAAPSSWNGNVGFGFSQVLDARVSQSVMRIDAVLNQPADATGELAGLTINVVDEFGQNSPGVALIAQTSVAVGNSSGSLSTINSYAFWPAGSQGGGGAQEVDVRNDTGADDTGGATVTTKSGILLVSQGNSKPWQAVGITASGAPFINGVAIYAPAISRFAVALYGAAGQNETPAFIDHFGNVQAASTNITPNVPAPISYQSVFQLFGRSTGSEFLTTNGGTGVGINYIPIPANCTARVDAVLIGRNTVTGDSVTLHNNGLLVVSGSSAAKPAVAGTLAFTVDGMTAGARGASGAFRSDTAGAIIVQVFPPPGGTALYHWAATVTLNVVF